MGDDPGELRIACVRALRRGRVEAFARALRLDPHREAHGVNRLQREPQLALDLPFSNAATQKRLAPMRSASSVCVMPAAVRA